MSLTKGALLLITTFFLCCRTAGAVDYATLEVRLEGVYKSRRGEAGVALFKSPKGFPIHLEHSYELQWVLLKGDTGSYDFVFEGLPAGDYAVTAIHDENGNRKIDRNSSGFPKEGVGFSNDQKVRLAAPRFHECQFVLKEGEERKIVIKLDYESGR